MRPKIKALGLLLICAAMLLLLSGCTRTENMPSVLEDGYIKAKENTRSYDFIFVCPMVDNEYWQECAVGIRRADAELGTKTKVLGPDTFVNFPMEVVNYVAEAIEEAPDGILAYSSIPALTPYIEEAAERGIPFVSIDAKALTDKIVAYVGTDLYNMGFKAGETMVEYCGVNASVGYLCSYFDVSNEAVVFDAFCDAVRDFNLSIAVRAEGHNNAEDAYAATEKMLAETPNITAIFCTGGENVTGAGRYLADAGLDIALMGLDDTEDNLQLVREGTIDALIAQSPEEMGYIGVYVMKEYLDNGTLAERSYSTDSILITKDNLDTYNADAYSPDLSLKTVRLGYYGGDSAFQSGADAAQRKSGYAYEYALSVSTVAGWKFEYVYGSRAEMIEQVKNGQVDMIAGVSDSEHLQNAMLISEHDMGLPGPKRYFAVSRERPDIMEELNGAMGKLLEERPGFTASLYNKYYGKHNSNSALTEAERDYLKGFDALRFGYLGDDNLPICSENANGEPEGLVLDVMKYIAGFTHLPVRPVSYSTADALTQALQNGEIDIAFPSCADYWMNEQHGLRQTDSFVSDRMMIIYAGNYSPELFNRFAVNRNSISQISFISNYYPNAKIAYFDSREDVFSAIKRGEERCAVGYSNLIQHFLFDNPQYADLHFAYLDNTVELCMTVNEGENYLVSILNKALSNMGTDAINASILSNTGREGRMSVSAFLREYSYETVFVLMGFLAIIAVVFAMYYRKARRLRRIQKDANAAITNALNAANEANMAKTNFLSSISHDIRTPMNAIVGMAMIAANYPDDKERVQQCLQKISVSGQHLLTLINDIIDISKIESGKLTLTPIAFSLEESLSTMKDIFSGTARDKGQTLEIRAESLSRSVILADRVRIEQVFINLLSNAIKYTPAGGRVTAVLKQTLNADGTRAHMTYTVEDTGIGMSEKFMSTMYESFSRAHDSRIDKIQGSGLGLAIVKQVVDMMGGTIQCESKEKVGTKFTVEFDVPVLSDPMPGQSISDSEFSLEGLHLLIAEDNDLNWEVISEVLNIEKATCVRAENGQVCIDMLCGAERGTYDLVLMDVQMPILNGKEATRRIRALPDEALRHIPIIAMTADAFAEDIADCFAAGMNGHVAKPLELDKLTQEIQKALSQSGHPSAT